MAPALLIVAVVGYFLLVKPKQEEAGRLGDEVAELQSKVDVALAAQNRGAAPKPETAIRVADVFKLTKAMPDRDDMPGIMLELNAVAAATGVEFLAITPSAPLPQTGFTAIPIGLTFEGSYYDLSDFLFRLRNLVLVRDGRLQAQGRLFTLDSLDLHEGEQGFPQIQAALTVSAYVYAPDSAPAAPGTAPAAPAPPATTTTTTTAAASDGEALGGS
jgi:Tfp pilus assembly protein PilO